MAEINGHVDLFTNFPTVSIELLNESDERFETSVIWVLLSIQIVIFI